jgi:hypothetical protein
MKDIEMEKSLIEWIKQQIEGGNMRKLTQKFICQKALELSNGQFQFVASRGWFHKFQRRINLKKLLNQNEEGLPFNGRSHLFSLNKE